jgi:hypothetical protein
LVRCLLTLVGATTRRARGLAQKPDLDKKRRDDDARS